MGSVLLHLATYRVADVTSVSLTGQVVVITGGSMGIGYACALEAKRSGADVVIAARGTVELDAAAARLRRSGTGRVVAVATDVTDPGAVRALFDAAQEIGGVTGVVHAAGVYGPIGSVPRTDPAAWFDAVRVNLFGTYVVAREACARIIRGGTSGSIVLLAGGGAAGPFPNYTAYAVSKAGVVRLAETLAMEMAEHRIRVNAIAPGFVATRLHQETIAAGPEFAGTFYSETRERLEKSVPVEVSARAAAFLLSPASAGITGRFVAAPYDDWERWPEHSEEIASSDLFTLRRITPRDRGKAWQ